ncbi:MAG: hypothetical protein HY695_13965 [Deltaproteobacteria bacterium]|nr:hypothetical protein [Deltaproteobacteria bacterium]
MKKKLICLRWVFVMLLFGIGCGVPYSLVGGRHVASSENFAVDLPQGWRQHNLSADPLGSFTAMLEKRRKLSWDVIRLTRDGLVLQQICIGRIPVAEELPHTKRKLEQKMIPLEAAEVIGDDIRSNSNLTQQEIIENTPATVGGYSGFKLHYIYRTEDRLKVEALFYGALVGPWLYYVLYEAPAQHYFAKDLQLFDRTRASFQILPKGPP